MCKICTNSPFLCYLYQIIFLQIACNVVTDTPSRCYRYSVIALQALCNCYRVLVCVKICKPPKAKVSDLHISMSGSFCRKTKGNVAVSCSECGYCLKACPLEIPIPDYFRIYNHHMVQPGMVYITFPTELGGLYTKQELADIYDVCRKYSLYLYIDGARLGYALASDACDVTLPYLAKHCDVFYIGGTKVGAMFGEAVVYTNTRAPKHLFTIVKNHGALLAKGRMLGIQFDTLFSDDLYFRISRHAIQMAKKLKTVFERHGFRIGIDSPTNQQFVVLSPEQKKQLMRKIAFEVWEPLNENEILCRFVTSWATTDEDIIALDEALNNI